MLSLVVRIHLRSSGILMARLVKRVKCTNLLLAERHEDNRTLGDNSVDHER